MDVQSTDSSLISLDEGGKKSRRPKRKAAPTNDTEYVSEASSKPVARKGKKVKGSEQYLFGDGFLLDTADSTQLSSETELPPAIQQAMVSLDCPHGFLARQSCEPLPNAIQ
jgi:hypothetical protein